MLMFFVVSICVHSILTTSIDLADEYAKVDEELKNITDASKREELLRHKLVAERIQVQNERIAKEKAENRTLDERGKAERAEQAKNFHGQISSLVLIRDTLDKFKEEYLERMCNCDLSDAQSITSAYWDFFDPEYIKKNYIREMSDDLYFFLKSKGMKVKTYISKQKKCYITCSDFIHAYRKYCLRKLESDECSLLIRMAPKIEHDFKEVVDFLLDKI